jgi:putative transcriptional regulator
MINLFENISKVSKMKPKKGCVLLAEPFMTDDHFSRSVIYLCEHNEEGSYGFILNNKLELTLDQIIPDNDLPELDVSYGGPVHASNLFFIHQYGELVNDAVQLDTNLWTGGDFEQLIDLIKIKAVNTAKIRFFLGYSGWSLKQLEDEMNTRSWIVTSYKSDNLFEYNKDLWKTILINKGGKFKAISNFPLNPVDN